MSYSIVMPVISAVSISPNPADTAASLSVSVSVADQTITLYPAERLAGTFYSGEEGLSWQ